MPKKLFTFIFILILPQLFGIIGAVVTAFSVTTWYPTLIKSPLNPPGWVFAPVWTILFLFMGIAAYYVWDKGWKNKNVKIALAIFMGQLVLNLLWSILFFGFHRPDLAFIEICVLWLAILATIISFNKISKLAAILLIPYLLWVSFAAYLNFSIWQINQNPPAISSISEQGIPLPRDYTLDDYKIEKVLDQSCRTKDDCQLPFEYAIRSNCPYVAPCLNNKCTVVCPNHKIQN